MFNKKEKQKEVITKGNEHDLAYIIGNRREIFWRNFLAGISRGIGIGIGVTVITAILIYFAQKLITMNIPIIGEYIVDIVEIVEQKKY